MNLPLYYYVLGMPLGILGLIRWGTWLVRRIPAVLYKPVINDHRRPLTIVVPTYVPGKRDALRRGWRAANTELSRGSVGLDLSRSDGVHLEQVTVTESAQDGLVLSGDQGTTMSGIQAVGNGENGVLVTGSPSPRPVTGIATTGNGAYGVAVVGQDGVQVSGVTTEADAHGGKMPWGLLDGVALSVIFEIAQQDLVR